MKRFQVTPELVGKYINQCLWSDTNPVGSSCRGKQRNIHLDLFNSNKFRIFT